MVIFATSSFFLVSSWSALFLCIKVILTRAKVIASWKKRAEHSSWSAHQIRRAQLSIIKTALGSNISKIKVLVALCPLLVFLGQ